MRSELKRGDEVLTQSGIVAKVWQVKEQFIVLDRDILTCPVEQVKDIQVEATYLGGARVYARPAGR